MADGQPLVGPGEEVVEPQSRRHRGEDARRPRPQDGHGGDDGDEDQCRRGACERGAHGHEGGGHDERCDHAAGGGQRRLAVRRSGRLRCRRTSCVVAAIALPLDEPIPGVVACPGFYVRRTEDEHCARTGGPGPDPPGGARRGDGALAPFWNAWRRVARQGVAFLWPVIRGSVMHPSPPAGARCSRRPR